MTQTISAMNGGSVISFPLGDDQLHDVGDQFFSFNPAFYIVIGE